MYPWQLLAFHVLAGFLTVVVVVLGNCSGFSFQDGMLQHMVSIYDREVVQQIDESREYYKECVCD